MSALVLSRHAQTRMRQRGMRPADLDIVLRCGSEIGGDIHDIYFLKRKDAQREINELNAEIRRVERPRGGRARTDREQETRRLRHRIGRLERLEGWKLVVAGGTVVTCYRSGRSDRKRMLRHARARA